ncbi:hypothetical protein C5612_29715 [Pseudomonas frederiksbergensis]|uniref:Uncharacterized protein n=1 Tax=Pseudomonas frederiksbergensis TaxID=104087 RepID=A0A2S8H4X6_9PSED|nr:hypothetical protein C5612_29715 [Pseudomonas frederiksbergensis]
MYVLYLPRHTEGPNDIPPVGAGLLAKAVGQSTLPLNDPPLSRASPLPQFFCVLITAQAQKNGPQAVSY